MIFKREKERQKVLNILIQNNLDFNEDDILFGTNFRKQKKPNKDTNDIKLKSIIRLKSLQKLRLINTKLFNKLPHSIFNPIILLILARIFNQMSSKITLIFKELAHNPNTSNKFIINQYFKGLI